MKNGDTIRFKRVGFEVADARNPNPPVAHEGVMNGGPNETHVCVWCEREGREATTIMVALTNIISVNGKPNLNFRG